VFTVEPEQRDQVFAAMLERSDAVLIIAPETDGILARLSRIVDDRGLPLLGSFAGAVKIAGDKGTCYKLFSEAGLPTPLTVKTSIAQVRQAVLNFGFPLVAKPLDGVGSEGVCLIDCLADLDHAVDILRSHTGHAEILLQKFVPGIHASVSMLISGDSVLPLSLNGQQIEIGCPFTYKGGLIPLEHPLQARAFENAAKAVHLIPGLQGYVGVDMILDEQEAWVIEVNPRITTSYIGLRQVLGMNLAGMIYRASIDGVLPESVQLTGQVYFAKNDL
jgi:predicted ATP-grasp superfamily ATP-dependent carboligase